MKKLFIIAACALLTMSCQNKEKEAAQTSLIDSLSQVNAQKDSEINDMLGTLNDIQEGFRLINEAEGRINLEGEGADKRQQMKGNIVFISNKMAENRELIAKLRQQLKNSNIKADQLNRTLENMTKQLADKDAQLRQLREELDKKDIHISELDETIANLNTNVSDLQSENEQKTQTISTQDKQLNTAWYCYGTKKELKDKNLLSKGDVEINNSNKGYFTKIDIRQTTEIKLYSKSAKMLTVHPDGSYTLTTDTNKQYVLKITNPQLFWSTSKYLVIQVK